MSSSGVYLTHDANRIQNKEDLLDVITELWPSETPLFTGLEKGRATNVYHEFVSYTVSRPTTINASVEGEDDTFSTLANPTRHVNYVQEVTRRYKVSYAQARVDTVGSKELARRRVEAMKRWKMDMEFSLIFGSGNSGASNTARVMKGLLVSITTNATNTSGASLTEANFNNYLQMAYNDVEDDTFEAYFDIRLKRVVSAFTAGITKNIAAQDKRLINSVDVYESDVAKMVKLFGHRDLSGTNRFFAIQPRAFKVAVFENPRDIDVPSVGNFTAGKVYGAGTLEFLYEQAAVAAENLA